MFNKKSSAETSSGRGVPTCGIGCLQGLFLGLNNSFPIMHPSPETVGDTVSYCRGVRIQKQAEKTLS